ncbi:MAG: ABC transporter ATP-binding protein [Rhizobiales bacterium 62-47]|nr:ABC transporter ATP-binding protein [Hyphomicrobiales bacterium]OJY08681.1 MAG: ABC transporter ATP-binding protein [Rhizobiales bacterium 62-47]
MLSLQNVHVHIGKLHILQGVNLDIKPGESTALLGRNGVGKTTTLRAIMGLVSKSRGSIEFDGVDLARLAPHKVPGTGIGYVPQGRGIFPNLSVLENLCIGLPGKRDTAQEDYVFSCFPRLKERIKQSGNTLSGGEQQMLAIARCLMMRPKLIILDEPTEGIMPLLVSQIRREIYRINQSGVSILLVEQNIETALKLCPRVFLMEKGTVVYSGTSQELKSQTAIVHRYLGLSR